MCLNRYETTLRLPNVYVSVPYMKYLCGMLCIMPSAPVSVPKSFFKSIIFSNKSLSPLLSDESGTPFYINQTPSRQDMSSNGKYGKLI